MVRSSRGLGLVLLVVLVVAPLTLFGVLSLFERTSADAIDLSLDGAEWTPAVDGTLLTSAQAWDPGETRSAIVYVRNDGPDPVDADVAVQWFSDETLVADGYVSVTSQVDDDPAVSLPGFSEPYDVRIRDLGSHQVVPLTLTATLADTAPVGATLDGNRVRLDLSITGARTRESGAPSLLDATGAQLWLAPILLGFAAMVALLVLARRGRRRSGRSLRSGGAHSTPDRSPGPPG